MADRHATVPQRRLAGGMPETLAVLALVTVALVSVVLVVFASIRTDANPPSRAAVHPRSLMPARPPYADLMNGRVEEAPDGTVAVTYDFEPIARVEGRVFSEEDLVPQLEDWNLKVPGSRVRTHIIRGEWRLRGEGRTRLAFSGPVRVETRVTLVSGEAAVQMATNRLEEGVECRLFEDGRVVVACLPEAPKDAPSDAPRGEPVVLAQSEPTVPGVVGATVTLACELDAAGVRVQIDGRDVVQAAFGARRVALRGNIALRSTVRAYWDDVTIRGAIDPEWVEERLFVALSLLSRDFFESDGHWTTARELMAGSRPQSRTLFPEGDVDWVAIVSPGGSQLVRVELSAIRFGIRPELLFYRADGTTPLDDVRATREGSTAFALVPFGEDSTVYLRLADAEGRRGTYEIAARVVPLDARSGGAIGSAPGGPR
jgi:hypothetical protein